MTPDELAQAYAAAWLELDADKRLARLRECCTEDVRFVPEGGDVVDGVEALAAGIGAFQASWPPEGMRVEITSRVQEHHGYGRGSFAWIDPQGNRFCGTDFAQVRDGKLALIVVFGDDQPPSGA